MTASAKDRMWAAAILEEVRAAFPLPVDRAAIGRKLHTGRARRTAVVDWLLQEGYIVSLSDRRKVRASPPRAGEEQAVWLKPSL